MVKPLRPQTLATPIRDKLTCACLPCVDVKVTDPADVKNPLPVSKAVLPVANVEADSVTVDVLEAVTRL